MTASLVILENIEYVIDEETRSFVLKASMISYLYKSPW